MGGVGGCSGLPRLCHYSWICEVHTETGYSLANYEVVKSLILCRYTDTGWVSFSLCANPMYQSVSALNMKWNRRGNRPLHNLTTVQFLCWRAYKIQHCCFLWDSFSNGGTPAQFEYHSLFCFWKDLPPLFVNYESKWRVLGVLDGRLDKRSNLKTK